MISQIVTEPRTMRMHNFESVCVEGTSPWHEAPRGTTSLPLTQSRSCHGREGQRNPVDRRFQKRYGARRGLFAAAILLFLLLDFYFG